MCFHELDTLRSATFSRIVRRDRFYDFCQTQNTIYIPHNVSAFTIEKRVKKNTFTKISTNQALHVIASVLYGGILLSYNLASTRNLINKLWIEFNYFYFPNQWL